MDAYLELEGTEWYCAACAIDGGNVSHNAEWEAEQAKKLIGHKIVGVVVDTSGEPEYWGLILQNGERSPITVWVESDEEGNDCGHLCIPWLTAAGERRDQA